VLRLFFGMLFGAEQFEKYIGKLYLAMQSDHIAKDLQRDFERHQAGPGKKDVVTQCNTGIPVYLHIKPDNNTSTMISNALLLSLATYVWQQTHVLFLRPRDPLATCIVGKIMVPSLSFSASREVASIANPEPLPPREGERERERIRGGRGFGVSRSLARTGIRARCDWPVH